MLAEAEGVVAVAAVGRAPRRLHVGHPPRLGAEHAEEGVGVHGARPHLEVVGLLQDAPLVGPELRQLEDELLEGLHRGGGGWLVPWSVVEKAAKLIATEVRVARERHGGGWQRDDPCGHWLANRGAVVGPTHAPGTPALASPPYPATGANVRCMTS